MTGDTYSDWEDLLAAERHLQALVKGSVLVGGTAAALHAGHRVSMDGDHVVVDLRERFDEERLGEDGTCEALRKLDALYPQPSGASVLAEVAERLGSARPVDVAEIDLAGYRGLQPPWNDWQYVASRGRAWAGVLADLLLSEKEDGQ
jgi:hypothetical protein